MTESCHNQISLSTNHLMEDVKIIVDLVHVQIKKHL